MRINEHTFLAALTYFTRIRSPLSIDAERAEGSACLAPIIGWIVGAVAGAAFAAGYLVFPIPVAIVVSMAATVLVTGGLHEDGWMDFCEGFGGGSDRETTLRIMRDSQVGAFAVLGAAVLLLLKFTALVALASELSVEGPPMPVVLALVFVAGHGISRFAAVAFMYTRDYVSAGMATKAASMAKRMDAGGFAVAALGGVLPVVVLSALSGWNVVFAIVPLLFVYLAMDYSFKRRLGGYTGDCLGAVQQLSEVVFYLGVIALTAP